MPIIWLNWGNRPDRMNLPPSVLHVYDPDGRSTAFGKPLPSNGSHVLEEGSWAAAVVDELAPEPGDIAVSKYRMSGFQDTELDSILRGQGITSLLFAGINTDRCVFSTLQDAAFLGYDCVLLRDACSTPSPAYVSRAIHFLVAQCHGFVATAAALNTAIASHHQES